MNKQGVFSLLVLAMIALGQAAPTNPTPDASSTSVPTTAPITDTKISALKVSAIQETYAVLTEIHELENHMEETYNLSHQNCSVRFEPTNAVDVNTLKDDVKSLNRLLPVIRDLADNEADYIIQDYYEKIVYSTNRSIAALNNLIAALEKNNDEGEETNGSDNTTEIKLTNSTTDKTTDVGSEVADNQCQQSDKAVKLSALKLQIELTYGDVLAIGTISL